MPRRPLSPSSKTVHHAFRLPVELDRRLRARAIADGDRPVSEVIREAIEAYLDARR